MIRLHPTDEEDLRYWANDWVRGDAGVRSVHGSTQAALLRGTPVTSSRPAALCDRCSLFPEITTCSCPPKRAQEAVRREREFAKRIEHLSGDERLVLRHAFLIRDVKGLMQYGSYPCAVFGCQAVLLRYKDQGGHHQEFMAGWLKALASAASAPSKRVRGESGVRERQKRAAGNLVAELREAAERDLLAALLSMGAVVEGVDLPRSVPVRRVAEAMGMSEEGVWQGAKRRLVRRYVHARHRLLETAELPTKWPEAHQAVGMTEPGAR